MSETFKMELVSIASIITVIVLLVSHFRNTSFLADDWPWQNPSFPGICSFPRNLCLTLSSNTLSPGLPLATLSSISPLLDIRGHSITLSDPYHPPLYTVQSDMYSYFLDLMLTSFHGAPISPLSRTRSIEFLAFFYINETLTFNWLLNVSWENKLIKCIFNARSCIFVFCFVWPSSSASGVGILSKFKWGNTG